MTKQSITKELLNELFEYKDGELYRKIVRSNRNTINDKAGYINPNGYKVININGCIFKNHRLIFLMINGYLPNTLDHIDGNKLNNKIENLREATKVENGQNSKLSKRNTSGAKGISWNKRISSWNVRLTINGITKSFGYYKNLELAELVSIEAREKYHGTFANHG